MIADTGFNILAVWGRAHYFSVTEASHNIDFLWESREEIFCFFETWMPERGSNPWPRTFQTGSFNHCTRAPATAIIFFFSVRGSSSCVRIWRLQSSDSDVYSASTKHLYNIYTTSVQHIRRCSNNCINILQMFCICCVNTVPALRGLFELGVFLDKSDLIERAADCVNTDTGFKQKGSLHLVNVTLSP